MKQEREQQEEDLPPKKPTNPRLYMDSYAPKMNKSIKSPDMRFSD